MCGAVGIHATSEWGKRGSVRNRADAGGHARVQRGRWNDQEDVEALRERGDEGDVEAEGGGAERRGVRALYFRMCLKETSYSSRFLR